MIWSDYLFFIKVIYIIFLYSFAYFRFDLELQNWEIDTTLLKEPLIMQRIKGWTEEWEKERHKKNDAISKTMFVNKYEDTMFDLLDAGNNRQK